MSTKRLILFALVANILNIMHSQEAIITPNDSIIKSSWVLGVGYNVVDDSATPFGWDVLKIEQSWNALPYPTRISVGKFWKSGLGFTAIGTYNKYKIGKLVDGEINNAERDYYAADGMISYDLNKLIGSTSWFDPYLHAGVGYSSIGEIGRATANAGFGFRTWFSDKWGLNFDTMGKWGLGETEGSTKQLQHSAGVIYRFGIGKGLSKNGLEKSAMLEEIEKRQQIYQDSILAVKQQEKEAGLLAQRLEKEKSRLLKLENEETQKKLEKENLENQIKEIGHVYFDLNSSYLSPNSKKQLDKLALLLKTSPTLKLKITSHADARGTDDYNMWLSERRTKRIVDYMIHKRVNVTNLKGEAAGEKDLINECKNGIYCSDNKHKENRRSEFKIINF